MEFRLLLLKSIAVTLCLTLSGFSFAKIGVEYLATKTSQDKVNLEKIKKNGITQRVIELMDETVNLESNLKIQYGGEDGPLFDSEHQALLMPYSFITEIEEQFNTLEPALSESEMQQAIDSVLAHTLLHEIGHSLVYVNGLPVLGREEDAVDSFATVWLLEGFEDGQQMAFDAALMFALESEEIDEFMEEDFWGEHSLDKQRYYQTLCLIFGSDPEAMQKKTDIFDEAFVEERGESCSDDYEIVKESWQFLTE